VRRSAATAERFFERRTRLMTRAFGSPSTPRTVLCGRNPGKAYASHSRRCRFVELAIRKSSQFRATQETSFFTRQTLDLPPQFGLHPFLRTLSLSFQTVAQTQPG
jgi:hypothetical protein